MEWEEPVPHSRVYSKHILPQIEWIVSVVGQQVGMGVPEEGGGGTSPLQNNSSRLAKVTPPND